MEAYLYMFLALAFAAAIGLLYKLAGIRGYNILAISVLYFSVALVAILIYSLFFDNFEFDLTVIGIGLLGGIGAFGATWAVLNALRFGKVSTSWTILGLSLVIPTTASMVFWGERLTPAKGLGFVLVCLSIILMGQDK